MLVTSRSAILEVLKNSQGLGSQNLVQEKLKVEGHTKDVPNLTLMVARILLTMTCMVAGVWLFFTSSFWSICWFRHQLVPWCGNTPLQRCSATFRFWLACTSCSAGSSLCKRAAPSSTPCGGRLSSLAPPVLHSPTMLSPMWLPMSMALKRFGHRP